MLAKIYSDGLKSFHHCLGIHLLVIKHENTYINHYNCRFWQNVTNILNTKSNREVLMVWRDEKRLYFIINETFIRIIGTYIFVNYNKWDATKKNLL